MSNLQEQVQELVNKIQNVHQLHQRVEELRSDKWWYFPNYSPMFPISIVMGISVVGDIILLEYDLYSKNPRQVNEIFIAKDSAGYNQFLDIVKEMTNAGI